jgi:hypothetical protein
MESAPSAVVLRATRVARVDLPSLSLQAGRLASRTQRHFFILLGAELVLLPFGTGIGLFDLVPVNLGPFTLPSFGSQLLRASDMVAAVLLLAALILRLIRTFGRSDTRWYEARAVAESAKSLGWRYAVGGQPFEKGTTAEADQLLRDRLQEALTDVSHVREALAFKSEDQVTKAMRQLRDQALAVRQDAYLHGRILDQQAWYTRKQMLNRNRALVSHWLLAMIELAAVVLVLLHSIKVVEADVDAVLIAVVGGGIAWTQAKRYRDLSASYRIAASEAGDIATNVPRQTTELAWAAFVDEAEEAFSREHRLWRATRAEDKR